MTKRHILHLLKKELSERSLSAVAKMHGIPKGTLSVIISTNGKRFPRKWFAALGYHQPTLVEKLFNTPLSERDPRVLKYQLEHREPMQ